MERMTRAVEECRARTARMLEAAERGDWTTVAALDAERRACFDGVDVSAPDPDAFETVLAEFRALMDIDACLRARAAEARHAALGEVRRIRGRRHGRASYRELAARG